MLSKRNFDQKKNVGPKKICLKKEFWSEKKF